MLEVLVVDDDEIVRSSIAKAIAEAGHRVAEAIDGAAALNLIKSRAFDLAVCDVQMPHLDGFALLRTLRRESPATAVVIMTSFGIIPDVVCSLRGGAVDYVTKPFDPYEFTQNVVGPIASGRELMKKFDRARAGFVAREVGAGLVGTSLVMRQMADRIAVIGRSDASVFLTGERGTGKKLIARTLHAMGPRRQGPLHVIACESLRDLMFESELCALSHVRPGSSRDGWLRAAEGGTLVLDGIDKLPVAAQSNLLRVVDERSVHAHRDPEWQPRGVRLIATSRRSPLELLDRGFPEPLIFRLNVAQIRVPSLSERGEDFPVLVGHFLREFTSPSCTTTTLTPAAWQALSAYPFPGNVGELAWVIERSIASADGDTIDVRDLPDHVAHASGTLAT